MNDKCSLLTMIPSHIF